MFAGLMHLLITSPPPVVVASDAFAGVVGLAVAFDPVNGADLEAASLLRS